ncbi:bifunctional 2-keto-4-hydroxyglutarate aldolase/2-keto-3-deoxy-6-phosphogluconate aldolase [Solibacillus sp. FSL K6-4121]|uniref:bifunctional 2-keto-4-hydroxyglutarate aldolase/2-keto-3-deoxy-6-phosphogluconate aldolase n=1 Tax=Solibacillus sp. FSL K6-4121 TaxID=2921505 RepID=UPI0030F55B31
MEIKELLRKEKLVAVIRANDAEEAISIINLLAKEGIRLIELTYTVPQVEEVFKEFRDNHNLRIGAGTVLDTETARHAILSGANFLVSPHFDKEIAKLANRYQVLYLPGCMTISEMVTALEYGCSIIKLFPASNFDPSFIRAVKGPLPQIEVMPTGGVGLNNLKGWIENGAIAVGVGSDFNKAFLQGEEEVSKLAQNYLLEIGRKSS